MTAIRAALDTLKASPLRTLLSTLGVVIGVASLVAILALSDGLEAYSRAQIARTTDLQTVMVTPRTSEEVDGVRVVVEDVPRLDRGAAAELGERLGPAATLSLFVVGSGRARVPGDTVRRAVLLAGAEPSAASQLKEGLAAGRYLSWADVGSDARVAVVPRAVAGWYEAEPEGVIGRTLSVDEVVYRIVGVAAGEGGSVTTLHVPLGEAVRSELERGDRPVGLAIRAEAVEDVEAVTAAVESWLEGRYGSADRFRVVSYERRASQAREAMLVFKLVMGSIAGVSLLVGGIGIMNILLASVFERTREIGIRKATGARQRDILLQFLAEAVTVTGVGSVVGVGVGLVGAFVITEGVRRISDAPVYAAYTWSSVGVAVAAAVVVGLLSGTYPARRAARLPPIEAIRHE